MAIYGSLDEVSISSLASSLNITAVATFVYDTSKDSDGGAWRKRTTNTTWYNETLNTSIRGSRREFPAVAVIVADQNQLIIYDGDDPDFSMWMVFNYAPGTGMINTNGSPLKKICALNGSLCWTGFRAGIINFIADSSELLEAGFDYNLRYGIGTERNSNTGYGTGSNSARQIRSNNTVDVDMTVLPGAAIDPKTNLPYPTIAIATDGGVSIVNSTPPADLNTIYDINSDGSVGGVGRVCFYGEDKLFVAWNTVGSGNRNSFSYYAAIYSDTNAASTSYRVGLYTDSTTSGGNIFYSATDAAIYGAVAMDGYRIANYSTSQHLTIIDEDPYFPSNGMAAFIYHSHNTGWMPGQCKACVLSSCQAETLTNGTLDADRTKFGNNPVTYGSVVKSTVSGSDIVGYAFNGSTNYMLIPYSADLVNIGTGDFTVHGWFYNADTATTFWDIADASVPRFFVSTKFGGTDKIWIYMNSGSGTLDWQMGSGVLNKTYWQHICVTRKSGVLYASLNGADFEVNNAASAAGNLNSTTAPVTIGNNYTLGSTGSSQMALWRFSRSAVTQEQVRKIYDDEKGMFDGTGYATIYGNTSVVADTGDAMAYDKSTGILYVGTSNGRSDFRGLARINNTTTAVTTSISAANGLVVEQ